MTTIDRRTLLIAATTMATIAATGRPAQARSGWPTGDSLWIWETPAEQWESAAAAMARAGLSAAYLSVPLDERKFFAGDMRRLEQALAPFARRNIAVLLAGGAPRWAVTPDTPAPLGDLLTLATGVATVKGVMLDIEPHALPEWKTADTALRSRYGRTTIRHVQDAATAMHKVSRLCGVVLHPSYANISDDSGVNIAEGLTAAADGVVIMAYRNTPQAIAAFAGKLLNGLDRRPNVPWGFGITVRGGQNQDNISYSGADWAQIRADMTALAALARGRPCGPAYTGVAINAYQPLLGKLPPP